MRAEPLLTVAAIAALGALAAPRPAPAQLLPSSVSVRVASGATVPSGPARFGDYYRPGLSVMASAEVPVGAAGRVGVFVERQSFGLDRRAVLGAELAGDLDLRGGSASVTSVGLTGRWRRALGGDRLATYATTTLGVASVSTATMSLEGRGIVGRADGRAGLAYLSSAGLGLSVDVHAVSLYAEGRYAVAFTDGSSTRFIPLHLGTSFGL